MIERLPNRELIELCLFVFFWGHITVIALLALIIYRIQAIKNGQNLIARGISRLMGIVGE